MASSNKDKRIFFVATRFNKREIKTIERLMKKHKFSRAGLIRYSVDLMRSASEDTNLKFDDPMN